MKRDEDGRPERGVLFVIIEVSEGKLKARGERHSTEGMSVSVRSRCEILGNRREVLQATVFKGFERSERSIKEGVEVRYERESRLSKAFEARFKIHSRGARRGAVMVPMLLEETEREVKEGNRLVRFTTYRTLLLIPREASLE